MSRPPSTPPPDPGCEPATAFVAEYLGDMVTGPIEASPRFRGGQSNADAAMASFDVSGYASERNEVMPTSKRGASALSPYIRHGLLTLPAVWAHVDGGPKRDVGKFRDELLWQEFARHWYARLGEATRTGIRRELPVNAETDNQPDTVWRTDMACIDAVTSELETDGWLVNQTRMWLASEWSIRRGAAWRDGEDYLFNHLLDGSRAANRLGWQWTTGVGSSKHYGFSRWQVNKRAPELCRGCALAHACPIEEWPEDPLFVDSPTASTTVVSPAADVAGPREPMELNPGADPTRVWLTAESLGSDDPALTGHPELPVVFVFDLPLLRRLRLSAKRLIFLTETLAELARERDVEIRFGDPVEALAAERLAVTYAPVPGFHQRSDRLPIEVLHPWPWLRRPAKGSVKSFSSWRKANS